MYTRYKKLIDCEEKPVSAKKPSNDILSLQSLDILQSVLEFLPHKEVNNLLTINHYFKNMFNELPPKYAITHFQGELEALKVFKLKKIFELQNSIEGLEARVRQIESEGEEWKQTGYLMSGSVATLGFGICWVAFLPQLLCGPCGPALSGPFGSISCFNGWFYPLSNTCVMADGILATAASTLPCTLNFKNCYLFSQHINTIKHQITLETAILESVPDKCDLMKRDILSKLSFFKLKLQSSVSVEEKCESSKTDAIALRLVG